MISTVHDPPVFKAQKEFGKGYEYTKISARTDLYVV